MALIKGQLISGTAPTTILLKAGSTWAKAGGYFCKVDAGYADRITSTDSLIAGWVDIGFDPSDSNVSGGVLTVPTPTTEKYRFPFVPAAGSNLIARVTASSAPAITDSGLACDISTPTTAKQIANLAGSTTKSLIVLPVSDEDIADVAVRVYVNPAKIQVA